MADRFEKRDEQIVAFARFAGKLKKRRHTFSPIGGTLRGFGR
jgi:hypothetical protein